MASLRERLIALPVLVSAAALGLAAEVALLFPLSRFIRERSTDIAHNFQLTMGFTLLVGLVSAIWLALIIRLLWGAEALWQRPRAPHGTLELEEDVFAGARRYRATTTKKALIFVVVVVVQLISLDFVGQGALVRETRVNMILTGLRSPNGLDRERVLDDAVLVGAHPLVTAALGQVMIEPGPARQWAAWAAGARRDRVLEPQLLSLMHSGNPDEVAASAIALSHIGALSLIPAAAEALQSAQQRRGDILVAIGELGKRRFEDAPQEREAVGELLRSLYENPGAPPTERLLVIWAIGRLEIAQMLPALEGLLIPSTDTTTLCVASSALANIGAADTSPVMISLCWGIGLPPSCPQLIYQDYSGREVLLSEEKPVQVRLLTDVALIGDRRAIPDLERMASSPLIHERAQGVAKEIAYAMRVAKR